MDDVRESRGSSAKMRYLKIKLNLNPVVQGPLTFTNAASTVNLKKEWMSKIIQRKGDPSRTFSPAMGTWLCCSPCPAGLLSACTV